MSDAKCLLVLRHAKSSWDDPGLADHDRPLAPRGRKAAKRIGARLREDQTPVDLVLCSTARRARDTVELVAPPGTIEMEDALYTASAEELLQRLRRVSDDNQVVMLVGHSPAIPDLTRQLLSERDRRDVDTFPTAALATLRFSGTWQSLAARQAALVTFLKPRELG